MRLGPLTRRRRLALVLLVTAVWALADAGDQAVSSVWAAGPLDETAHVLTGLLFVWAAGGVLDGLAPWLLAASVAIDLDHLPGDFGAQWLTAGDPRPYPHSLLTIVLVLVIAWRSPRFRRAGLGVSAGLVIHMWRDLSEPGTGVGLLWPATSTSFSIPHTGYLAGMAVIVAFALRAALDRPLWPQARAAGRSGAGDRRGLDAATAGSRG